MADNKKEMQLSQDKDVIFRALFCLLGINFLHPSIHVIFLAQKDAYP